MPYLTYKQRLKIALGGFLLFVGCILLVSIYLVVTGTVEARNSLQPELLIGFVAIIGCLDILAGSLLFRSR